MNNIWRVIVSIVLIAVLFGTVCIGVGLLTGADTGRIYSVLNNKYNLKLYYDYVTGDLYEWAVDQINSIVQVFTA